MKVDNLIRLGMVRDLARTGNCTDILGEYTLERDVFFDTILMEKLHIPYSELYEMDYDYFLMLLKLIMEKNRIEALQQR